MPIIREKDIHKYIDKKVIMQENKYTNPFNKTDVTGGAFYNAKRIYEGNGLSLPPKSSNAITDNALDKILNADNNNNNDSDIYDALKIIDSKTKTGGAIPWGSIANIAIPLIPEIIKAVPEVIGTIKKWVTGSGLNVSTKQPYHYNKLEPDLYHAFKLIESKVKKRRISTIGSYSRCVNSINPRNY